MNRAELYALVDKYLAGSATIEETDLLSRYYNSFQRDSIWPELKLGSVAETDAKLLRNILEKISLNDNQQIPEIVEFGKQEDVRVINTDRRKSVFTFQKLGIAACIIGLAVLVFWPGFKTELKTEMAQTGFNKKILKNDALPATNKAILKLADGSTIELDDAKNGELAQQGNAKVFKLNGKLNYSASNTTNEILYNTISTPRGGKYQIELSDGTLVWLNAASTLRFPAAFIGNERKVEISGEAYFEVAKNIKMPFVVSVGGAEIQVLGTHFNIMAYSEETSVKTTLVEGSVKFINNGATNILKPGQQSELLKDGKVKVINNAHIEEVLAWKNGIFHFQASDLGTVMRQLSRWYDVEVVYKKKTNDLFYVEMPRNTKLSDVLKVLELTGDINFNINGNKIIVMP